MNKLYRIILKSQINNNIINDIQSAQNEIEALKYSISKLKILPKNDLINKNYDLNTIKNLIKLHSNYIVEIIYNVK